MVAGVDGRRVRVRRGGFATRADAERAGWDLLQLPGAQAVARTWTLRRWLEFWLSEIDGQLRPTTVANYRWMLHRYLILLLGGQRLGKLRTKQVQRAMDVICRQRVRAGRLVSPGSVHRIRAVLRSALSAAGHDRAQPGVAAAPTERCPSTCRGVGRGTGEGVA